MQKTYQEFIQDILDTRGRFNCGDEYHERHHILPKSCGGSNIDENLIDLFAREHFEAHRLLALENPNNESLTYAWWMMSHGVKNNFQDICEITAKEYEEAKIAFSKLRTGRPVSDDAKKMIGEKNRKRLSNPKNHPMYGKHHTEETKQKLSEASKGRVSPMLGRHHTEESKKKMRENSVQSEQTKEILSNKAKERLKNPENNPMYGKHHSEETKQKLRDANKGKPSPMLGKHHTEELKKKMSETRKGKYSGENNPMWGKHPSEETKNKIRESNKGKHDGNKNQNYGKGRHVVQLSLLGEYIAEYISANEVEKIMGIKANNVRSCCNHIKGYQTAGGFKWMFKDEYEQLVKNDY